MSDQASINKYELAIKPLMEELERLGGQMVMEALSLAQLDKLREIDPAHAKSVDWMNGLLTGLADDHPAVRRYVALSEVIIELRELEERAK
jgi:hypothetical protein